MKRFSLAFLLLSIAVVANAQQWEDVSLKDIKPQGWIMEYLQTQKAGLTGNPYYKHLGVTSLEHHPCGRLELCSQGRCRGKGCEDKEWSSPSYQGLPYRLGTRKGP